MTYWIVMAMVAASLIAVIAAFASDADDRKPDGPTRGPRPTGYIWAAMSASDGTGDGTPYPARDNWIAQVAASLPADVAVLNLAVAGSTLDEARRGQLPAALAAAPDVVTVWLVINDLIGGVPLDDYAAQLGDVLRRLDLAGCQVVVGNVLDLALLPVVAEDADLAAAAREVVPAWNEVVARVVAEHGAALVDLFTESHELAAHPEYVGPDGFHPSPAGHARLAAHFRPAVEAALAAVREARARAA